MNATLFALLKQGIPVAWPCTHKGEEMQFKD